MPHAIQIRQTGAPEVLNWTAVDVGEPESGQVRLRHAAAGLNYIDVYHRTGYYPQLLPVIPGLEGAGIVEAVAQDVRGRSLAIRQVYAVKDAADAHKALEARATSGSTILSI
jgi:NADPH:quinone reductase